MNHVRVNYVNSKNTCFASSMFQILHPLGGFFSNSQLQAVLANPRENRTIDSIVQQIMSAGGMKDFGLPQDPAEFLDAMMTFDKRFRTIFPQVRGVCPTMGCTGVEPLAVGCERVNVAKVGSGVGIFEHLGEMQSANCFSCDRVSFTEPGVPVLKPAGMKIRCFVPHDTGASFVWKDIVTAYPASSQFGDWQYQLMGVVLYRPGHYVGLQLVSTSSGPGMIGWLYDDLRNGTEAEPGRWADLLARLVEENGYRVRVLCYKVVESGKPTGVDHAQPVCNTPLVLPMQSKSPVSVFATRQRPPAIEGLNNAKGQPGFCPPPPPPLLLQGKGDGPAAPPVSPATPTTPSNEGILFDFEPLATSTPSRKRGGRPEPTQPEVPGTKQRRGKREATPPQLPAMKDLSTIEPATTPNNIPPKQGKKVGGKRGQGRNTPTTINPPIVQQGAEPTAVGMDGPLPTTGPSSLILSTPPSTSNVRPSGGVVDNCSTIGDAATNGSTIPNPPSLSSVTLVPSRTFANVSFFSPESDLGQLQSLLACIEQAEPKERRDFLDQWVSSRGLEFKKLSAIEYSIKSNLGLAGYFFDQRSEYANMRQKLKLFLRAQTGLKMGNVHLKSTQAQFTRLYKQNVFCQTLRLFIREEGGELHPTPPMSVSVDPPQQISAAPTAQQVESPAKAGANSTFFSNLSISTTSSFLQAFDGPQHIQIQPMPTGNFSKVDCLTALKDIREMIPWNQKHLEKLTGTDLKNNFPLVYSSGAALKLKKKAMLVPLFEHLFRQVAICLPETERVKFLPCGDFQDFSVSVNHWISKSKIIDIINTMRHQLQSVAAEIVPPTDDFSQMEIDPPSSASAVVLTPPPSSPPCSPEISLSSTFRVPTSPPRRRSVVVNPNASFSSEPEIPEVRQLSSSVLRNRVDYQPNFPREIDAKTFNFNGPVALLWHALLHVEVILHAVTLQDDQAFRQRVRKELLRRVFSPSNTPFMNLNEIQEQLCVPSLGHYSRQMTVDHIRRWVSNCQQFERSLKFVSEHVHSNKILLRNRAFHLVSSLDHRQQSNLLQELLAIFSNDQTQINAKLAGLKSNKQKNHLILSHFHADDRLGPIIARYHNQIMSSEYQTLFTGNFLSSKQKQNRGSVFTLNETRFKSGKCAYDPQPVENKILEAGARFHAKFLEQCKFPAKPCTNCLELPLGAVVDPLCQRCKSKSKAEKFQFSNNMHPLFANSIMHSYPEQLEDLTTVEKLAISMVMPVQRIYYVNGVPTNEGHAVAYPQNCLDLTYILPRLPNDLSLVVFQSPFRSKKLLRARKDKIKNALKFLIENNAAYKNVVLNDYNLSAYDRNQVEVPTVIQAAANENVDDRQQPDLSSTPSQAPPQSQPSEILNEDVLHLSGQMPDIVPDQMELDLIVSQLVEAGFSTDTHTTPPPPPPPQTPPPPPPPQTQPASALVSALATTATEAEPGTTQNPLDWPPLEWGRPFSDMHPDFWSFAFPHLFPYGVAGYDQSRKYTGISRQDWVLHLLNLGDQRFAKDSNFIFYALSFIQKDKAWSAGRLWANAKFANKTKTEIEQQLRAEGKSLRDLAKEITRSTVKLPGSPAYLKKCAREITAFSNHWRHRTNDAVYLNLFQTLSAADHQWNDFFNLFPEGQQHLAKTVVKDFTMIPPNADPGLYTTQRQDFLFRRRFLVKYAVYQDIFFRMRTDLFMREVMIPVFGVTDYASRKEYQARGSIHDHSLLAIPLDFTNHQRKLALSDIYQTDDTAAAPVDPVHKAAVLKAQDQLVKQVRFQLGITEHFYADNMNDFLQVHGGTKVAPAGNSILRTSFQQRREGGGDALLALQERTCFHTCSRGKTCQRQDMKRRDASGKHPVVCKLGFPRPLVNFEEVRDEVDKNVIVDIRCTDQGHRVPGEIVKVDDLDSGHYGNIMLRMNRNHRFVNNINADLLLIWGANMDTQFVHSPQHSQAYIAKYACKVPQDTTSEEHLQQVFDRADETSAARQFAQRICLDASKSHPIPLAEAVGYLNKQNLVHLSRGLLYFNALEETAINANVRDTNEPISKKSRAQFFDQRHSDPKFLQAVQFYEEALASSSLAANESSPQSPPPPYHKHPAQFSLYEYLTFFDKDWIAVSPMPIVVVTPQIPFTPQKLDTCPLFRKFCIVMLRMHCADVPPLDQLQQWSTEQLHAKCDTVFTLGSTALWIVELWLGLHQYRPFEVPNAPLTPASGTADDLEDSLGQMGVPTAADAEDGILCPDDLLDDEDDVQFGQDDGSVQIDYLADIQRLRLQHWTTSTGEIQRRELFHPREETILDAEAHDRDGRPLSLSGLNRRQQIAVNLVVKLARPMFTQGRQFFVEICGAAGTGKTTVMQILKKQLTSLIVEVCPQDPVFGSWVHFAAPTGTAAKLLPLPTATLHSLLGIPISYPKRKATPKLSANALKRLQEELANLSILIIDEKSFVGLRLLHDIDANLRQIKIHAKNQPFGGVSIVLLGDSMQLAPVKDLSLCTGSLGLVPKHLNQFDRIALNLYTQNQWEVVILDTLCRQASDSDFAQMLNRFRQGQYSDKDWNFLAERFIGKLPLAERDDFDNDAVKVCARKRDFEAFTKRKIAALSGQKIFLKAVNTPPSGARATSSTAGGLPRNLLAANNMRVMLTVNLSIECGLTNGSLGTIVGILFLNKMNQVRDEGGESNQSANDLPTILVKFDNYRGQSIVIDEQDCGVPIDALTRTWYEGNVAFHRTMLPLVPAYAFSIHKAQGQTIDKMVLNVGQREFASGFVHTALT